MKFDWESAAPLDGELIYREGEYSIDFNVASPVLLAERAGSVGTTSLAFTTLQLEVGIERGELLYPWGLFPNTRWQTGPLTLPHLQSGRVRVVTGEALQAGVAVPIRECAAWSVVWDRVSGWICFGDPSPRRDSNAIEFARNAAVVFAGGRLRALWLCPKLVS